MIKGLKADYSEKFFKVNKYGEIINSNGVVVDLTKYAPPADLVYIEAENKENPQKKKRENKK